MLKSLKIPLAFLVTGIFWALLSDPVITLITKPLGQELMDLIRSLNNFIFVIVIAYVLYHEISRQQRKLMRSEAEYRQLFESNPNPMWIYRESDLRFIKVNDAAIAKYGYSRPRFLTMTILDIRPVDDQKKLLDYRKNNSDKLRDAGFWKHKKGNGELLTVNIVAHPVLFNEENCKMVLVNDVTAVIEKEEKLRQSYQKLKSANQTLAQVSWSNSHELRKPICSILGLIGILETAETIEEYKATFEMVKECADELDTITRKNNAKVSSLMPWQ